MTISNDVEQAATLRCEGPDFAISPARDDSSAIRHEVHDVAHGRLAFVLLKSDAQELFLIGHVPYADLISAAQGEYLAETRREVHRTDRVCDRGSEASGS